MPFDNPKTAPAPAFEPETGGLSDRARSCGPENRPTFSETGDAGPPLGNTGGTLRHLQKNKKKNSGLENHEKSENDETAAGVSQTTPPCRKRSRASITSAEMSEFIGGFFFDWLGITLPNPDTGKGEKTKGYSKIDRAFIEDMQEDAGVEHLTSWAAVVGLRKMRIGRGTDGYLGGMNLAFDPLDSERLATIRAGHPSNMPGLEIPGGRGHCAELAPLALTGLGPVLLARADVSRDFKKQGLFDKLHKQCLRYAKKRRMEPPRLFGSEETGRTLYFGGSKENRLKIYEKGKERLSKGTAALDDPEGHPHLVRVEFTIVPDKPKKKSGLARIAAEHGPGALLPTVNWIRHFVQDLAVEVGLDPDAATLSVGRVKPRPDPRPVEERAALGMKLNQKAFIAAAAKKLAKDADLDDWTQLKTDKKELVNMALRMAKKPLKRAAEKFLAEYGLGEIVEDQERADQLHEELSFWLTDFHNRTQEAKSALKFHERQAKKRCGAPLDIADIVKDMAESPAHVRASMAWKAGAQAQAA